MDVNNNFFGGLENELAQLEIGFGLHANFAARFYTGRFRLHRFQR
jgi:hypothetical protein